MAEPLFQLPRLDWYDEEGRIYKDALIENFNAIEEKLHYLNEHITVKVEEPDWSTVHIPTISNISTADEDSILSLKSFVDIMKIKNFPLICEFNGKKCVKLTYYNDNYQLVNIKDVTLSALNETTNMFVYLDYTNRRLITSGSLDKTKVLVGVYSNGNVYAVNDTLRMCDIDLPSILYKMPIETGVIGEGGRNSQYKPYRVNRGDYIAAWTDVNLHRVWRTPQKILPVDIGRQGGKTREVSNNEL